MAKFGSKIKEIVARKISLRLVGISGADTRARGISTSLNNFTTAVPVTKQQPCLLYSAICLQRQAIIIPPKTQIDKSFHDLMKKMEDENSKLSDHELRHLKDLEKIEQIRKGEEDLRDDEEYISAMDAEDAWETELNKFTVAQPQRDLELTSALRAMDRKIFFIWKQQLGEQSTWCFPQIQVQEGESLRSAAVRLLQETVGDAKVCITGNTPIGVHKYIFSKNGEQIPVKVFFHRVEISENMKSLSTINEHMWLTSEELKGYLPSRYDKVVKRFLLDL